MKLRCTDPDIVVKPRDVCRQARARCRRGTTPTAPYFAREIERAVPQDVDLRRPRRGDRRPGQFVLRDVAGDSIIVTRDVHRHACRPSTTSAATAARGCAPSAGHVRRQHPVPVSRLDLRPRRPADRRAAHGRSAALPQGGLSAASPCTPTSGTATSSSTCSDTAAPLCEQLADLPAKFHPWRMAGPPARPPHRLRRQGELEADRPELQRVPALPEPASGAQQAVALPERRERAAARDLHGRRMDLRPGVDTLSMDGTCPRALLPGCRAEDGGGVYYYAIFPNMLLSLHPDYMMVHTLWPIAPDRTINVCEWHFQPLGAGASRLRCRRCDRVLGHDEPAGLARLRAVAGGHLVARLHAGPVLESRGSALRVRPDDRGVARSSHSGGVGDFCLARIEERRLRRRLRRRDVARFDRDFELQRVPCA